MTSLSRGALRGIGSGAAGTAALNLTTYADMAVRGRPASQVPESVVATLAHRLGTEVPGRGSVRANRLQGLAAVTGTVNGMLVGALGGALRAAGVRLPTAVGGPLLGAAAMAGSDLPIGTLGISDPRRWTRQDWISDAIPHLIYGVVTHAGIVATARADEEAERRRADDPHSPAAPRRPSTSDLVRAAALGAATGCRSSAGVTALALTSSPSDDGPSGHLAGGSTRALHVAMAAAELGFDKHPSTPERVGVQGLAPRITLGATAAGGAARRNGSESGVPSLVGAAAAAGAAFAGVRARAAARNRFGSDLPGALIEDVVATLLAWAGTRRDAPRR